MNTARYLQLTIAMSLFVLQAWIMPSFATSEADSAFINAVTSANMAQQAAQGERTKTMKLLQMDFPHQGPGKVEMNDNFKDLAKSIVEYPGVIWKIWTVNEDTPRSWWYLPV